MAYFVKSTRSIGLTQSVLHFNFKSGCKYKYNIFQNLLARVSESWYTEFVEKIVHN